MAFPIASYPYTSGSRGSISEIYDIFRGHTSPLFDRQLKTEKAIDDWSIDLIKQIKDHAFKQKDLVNQAYKIHRKHLDDMCNQFVETYNIYQRKNDAEEIKRLIEKCKSLEIEVVSLKFPLVSKEFIEVTMVEPAERMEQEELNPRETKDDKFKSQSGTSDQTGSVRNRDSNSDLYPKSTTSTSDGTNQSSTTQSVYDRDQTRNTNDNKTSIADLNTDNNIIEKCPMCFMIFPSTMSTMGREMHVNEHYKDE